MDEEKSRIFGRQDDEFYASIGYLVIAWGEMEAAVDVLIDVSYSHYNADTLDTERPRTSLKKKLKFLRRFMKAVSVSDEIANTYLSLLNDISTTAELRHDVIHSSYTDIVESYGTASIVRLLHSIEGSKKKITSLDAQSIMKNAIMTQRRAIVVLDTANNLLEAALKRELPDVISE